MNIIQTPAKHLSGAKNIIIVALSTLTVLSVLYCGIQYNKINQLQNQIHVLDNTVQAGISKNTTLGNENVDMKKALVALQTHAAATNTHPTTITPTVEQAAKVTVTKVGHQAITVPANDYHGTLSTDHFAVYTTITNQSQHNQIYTEGSFYAVTDNGTIVKIPSFGPGIDQTVWRRTDLAPGGHADIILLFPTGRNITTLATAIPDTTDQIATPLPAAQ